MPPKKTNEKNEYVKELIEQFKKLQSKSIDDINIDLTKISLKQAIFLIKQNIHDMKLGIKSDKGDLYFLNDKFLNNVIKSSGSDENKIINISSDGNKSDSDFVFNSLVIKSFTLFRVEAGSNRSRPSGGFFKYLNNTHFDLDRYGIHKEVRKENYNENCLYLALKYGGMSDIKLEKLKSFVLNRIVPKCKLKEVCDTLEITIKLSNIKNDSSTRVEHYGNKESEEKYSIGLIDEHYFIIEKTEITAFCLQHYEEVKDIENCHTIFQKISEGKYKKRNDRGIDSFNIIKILIENKESEHLIKPLLFDNELMASQFYDKTEEYKTLEYMDNNIKYQKFETKEKVKYYKVYFDFETITNKTHVPYLVRYETEDGEHREFIGNDCALDMLNNLPYKKNIMLIAHNANYDCRFILKYLSQERPLVKGSRILTCQAVFYRNNDINQKINIVIKDSIKMINMPLREFGKSFKLEDEKEIMPYNVYTKENIEKVYIPIVGALHYIKDEDVKRFIKNIDDWGCRGQGGANMPQKSDFNIIKYSSKYCELDCHVLRKGYEKFREWMLEYTELDIDNYITIQSLCSDYKLKEGCYDGVAMVSGVIQSYISRCIVGGRCMTNSNKMYHVKRKLADFDACSLYPSAMYRMLGYLKGVPKVLTNLCYEFLKNQTGYFIQIRIKRVGIKRQFPLLSKYTENKVRMFSNDMVGQNVYIDKTGLEDVINFQDIDFEIIDGYYFNEGRNDTINRIINHLYSKRRELKKNKNPAQIVIKELMNSMYGKTILKPIETDTVVIKEDEYNKYVSYNYNFIYSAVQVGNRYYVKKIKSILEHFNYVHCGVEILSMSKRIMNEVICLAEDEKLDIFYQDTDSMHIDYNQITTLENKFKEKYGRELVGNDMGQFHCDFEMDGAKGEIYAIESLFLAKKVYIDKLESVDENNKTIHSNHIRLKSVPTSCVKHTSKILKFDNDDPLELYKSLYKPGIKIEFDLTENGNKCGFKYNRDLSVRSYEENEFTRTIGFDENTERIEIS